MKEGTEGPSCPSNNSARILLLYSNATVCPRGEGMGMGSDCGGNRGASLPICLCLKYSLSNATCTECTREQCLTPALPYCASEGKRGADRGPLSQRISNEDNSHVFSRGQHERKRGTFSAQSIILCVYISHLHYLHRSHLLFPETAAADFSLWLFPAWEGFSFLFAYFAHPWPIVGTQQPSPHTTHPTYTAVH